jgi:GWxTD domain-containing protein
MDRRRIAIIAAAAALTILASADLPAQKSALPAAHKKWLDEEVVYIITPLEREVFLKLQADRERDLFIDAFWKHRDPTPNTLENEFRTEHYRRITYANKYYGRSAPMPGWMTDRGRIYIVLGEPMNIERFDNKSGIYPVEIWFYQNKESYGLPTGFNIVFFQKSGLGDFKLYSPSSDGPMALMTNYIGDPIDYESAYKALNEIDATVASASLTLIPGDNMGAYGRPSLASDMLIQRVENAARFQIAENYARKFLEFKDVVEVEYSANYLESDVMTKVTRESSGAYFVHFAVEPKRLSVGGYEKSYSTLLKVNGTVATPEGKTVYQFDRPITVTLDEDQMKMAAAQPFEFHDMFPLVPGTFKFSVLVKNEESKEFMSFEQMLNIPGATPVLQMTSPVLGYKSARADASKPGLRPFQVGPFQLSIQPSRAFTKKDTLAVAFQVFGLSEAQRSSGEIRFMFTRIDQPAVERTRRLAECPDLPAVLAEFPLSDFAPAHYFLKVSLVDGSRELVAGTEEFDVTFKDALPRPWIRTKRLPEASDPVYSLIIGSQLFSLGRVEDARGHIEQAYHQDPKSAEAAVMLGRIYFALRQPEKVAPILEPFLSVNAAPKYEIYFLAGQALRSAGNFQGALDVFDRAVTHFGISAVLLNSIGDCYIGLGRPKDARTVWTRSLELNKDQPEIRKKLDAIKD